MENVAGACENWYSYRMKPAHAVSQMVLETLRQIGHAIDLRSRQLMKTVGLSVPQLLVLKAVADNDQAAIGRIAERVSLSQATVTTIVDRLEQHGLVVRHRDSVDRRRVRISATEAGKAMITSNPVILQEEFSELFGTLEPWEQTQILSSLQRVASMMGMERYEDRHPDEDD